MGRTWSGWLLGSTRGVSVRVVAALVAAVLPAVSLTPLSHAVSVLADNPSQVTFVPGLPFTVLSTIAIPSGSLT